MKYTADKYLTGRDASVLEKTIDCSIRISFLKNKHIF